MRYFHFLFFLLLWDNTGHPYGSMEVLDMKNHFVLLDGLDEWLARHKKCRKTPAEPNFNHHEGFRFMVNLMPKP